MDDGAVAGCRVAEGVNGAEIRRSDESFPSSGQMGPSRSCRSWASGRYRSQLSARKPATERATRGI